MFQKVSKVQLAPTNKILLQSLKGLVKHVDSNGQNYRGHENIIHGLYRNLKTLKNLELFRTF